MSEYVSRKNFWLTCIPDFAGKLQCVCQHVNNNPILRNIGI